MGNYIHLTYQERAKINMGLSQGLSTRAIARSIGRDPSAVSREIRRNGGKIEYHHELARQRAEKCKRVKKGVTKISKYPVLQEYIRDKLAKKWGPKVIARKWNQSNKRTTSTEAIYQWIYSDETRQEKLYLLLNRHKRKRGMRRSRPINQSTQKVHISQRPEAAEKRAEMGHCEADLLFCAGSQSMNALTCVDRKTRYIAIIKNESKRSELIKETIIAKLAERLPFKLLTLTLDNGSEFALHDQFDASAYFCDPGAPYQKGSVENVNKILRSYLPFRKPLDSYSQDELDRIADHINSIPREILDFLSPEELVNQLFKQNNSCVALVP